MNFDNQKEIKFKWIEVMPELPKLKIPDYDKLAEQFASFILNPQNGVLHYDRNKNPFFTAYVEGKGNEMVTWGVVGIGEKLRGKNTEWLGKSYSSFFSKKFGLYLNSPNYGKIEYWYMFYVHSLAGAVFKLLYPGSREAWNKWLLAADTMLKLTKKINYNFNDQGYDFTIDSPFTVRDVYRQPDSIAGYAYNMLFTAVHSGNKTYLDEALYALKLYQEMTENPWYEIPNGAAGALAAAWLAAKGYDVDINRIVGFVFDHEQGPLHIGEWNGEEINGLMMGWRGENRKYALSSAYSMETLMPLQFFLPAVRYVPGLARSIAKYVMHVLANFQLFYGIGSKVIYETRPDLSNSVPYEKLEKERDGYSPCACGDFMGHRSVYGGGYVLWLDAIVRKTEYNYVLALDISLTDWLSGRSYPTFMVYNPYNENLNVSFEIAGFWEKICPHLFREGKLHNFSIYSLNRHYIVDKGLSEKVNLSVPSKSVELIVLIPNNSIISSNNNCLFANEIPIDFCCYE